MLVAAEVAEMAQAVAVLVAQAVAVPVVTVVTVVRGELALTEHLTQVVVVVVKAGGIHLLRIHLVQVDRVS
jgi:hypothetical protein